MATTPHSSWNLSCMSLRKGTVLQTFHLFARRDDFGVAAVVGQAGSLRPIVNRRAATTQKPPRANGDRSAACRHAGQAAPGRKKTSAAPKRRIANPPQVDNLPRNAGDP